MNFINSLFVIYSLYIILNITSNGNINLIEAAEVDINADATKINNTNNMLNDQIYSKMFLRRREEHQILLDHFAEKDMYEAKYKLLTIGLNKILSVITESKHVLETEKFDPNNGFPNTEELFDAVTHILENTCLFGDLLLHLPDMAYDILEGTKPKYNWIELMNWALTFTRQFFVVIDETTQIMLSLFDQEMNPEKRTEDFINPYLESNKKIASAADEKLNKNKKTKKTKKHKKGPQLSSDRNVDKSEL